MHLTSQFALFPYLRTHVNLSTIFLILILVGNISIYGAVISNANDAGRLGDALFNYIKAKYLSYKYNIPFQLNPFPHSDQLILDDHEHKVRRRGTYVKVIDESQLHHIDNNTFYDVYYDCRINTWNDIYDTNTWNDIARDEFFMSQLRLLISSKKKITLNFPANTVTVAVHVRRPSGGDPETLKSRQMYDSHELRNRTTQTDFYKQHGQNFIDAQNPLKFPALQFYIDQIKKIPVLFPQKSILVYVFTDYAHPQELVDLFKGLFSDTNITFQCLRSSEYKACVIDDLMVMMHVDCLIRSKSNFSQMADFLGRQSIVISSESFGWYKDDLNRDCVVCEEIVIKKRNTNGTYTKQKIHDFSGQSFT